MDLSFVLNTLGSFGGIAITIFLLTVLGGILIASHCYAKTPSNKAFVRTGLGGRRVVLDGGALVIPFAHNIKWISLETMQLVVERNGKDALITKDKLRADLKAIFYIKIEPIVEQILSASRTLGDKSLSTDSVKKLVEAKLVGALRSVSATKQLVELHENRDAFADAVQRALREDLAMNGLTLEGVSIIELDQTPLTFFADGNVFDAEGLRFITERVEQARSARNEIEREAEVKMAEENTRAKLKILEYEKEVALAKATHDREVQARESEIADERLRADNRLAAEKDKLNQERELEARRRELENEISLFDEETKKAHKEREFMAEREARNQRELDIERSKALAEANLRVEVIALEKKALAAAELEHAEAEAQAITARSKAESASKRLAAETAHAEYRLVESAKLEIERARLELEREAAALKAQSTNALSSEALAYELNRAQIEANKDAAVRVADAMATAFSGASVSIQGGAETLRLFTGAMERLSDGNVVDFNSQVRRAESRGIDTRGVDTRGLEALEARRSRSDASAAVIKDARASS